MAIGINSYFHRRYWPAGLTLVLGLAISGGLGWRLHRQAVELDRLRLERIADVVLDRLHTRLQATDLILRQAQDHFGSQEEITESKFREWCRKYGWSVTAPWIHGLLFYTNLNSGQWRSVVPPNPADWTEVDNERFQQFAMKSAAVLKPGFDYFHDKTKRGAGNYTRRSRFTDAYKNFHGAIAANSPQTTDRQVVIEYADGRQGYGAAVAVPVYEVERDALREMVTSPPHKVKAHQYNWNLNRGVLIAPLDYVALEASIWGKGSKEVGVEIYASPEPKRESCLNEADHPPRALDTKFQPYLTHVLAWRLYNRRWSLFVYTLPAFEAGSPRYMARLTFIAGAAMTFLGTALVGLGLRARNRQEQLTAQIREARDALAAAQQERQKLSHDLHDNTVQSLYAIQLGLNQTSQKLEAQPASARRELSTVRAELDAIISEIRQFITAERGADDAEDLAGVLSALVERAYAGTSAQIQIQCDPDASARLADNQAVQLANIAREALSNSLRHARSQQVQIALRSEPNAVCLEVADDGIGFDPKTQSRGLGLTSMATRTRETGGTLDLQSSPGKGTRVVVRVPASTPELKETE